MELKKAKRDFFFMLVLLILSVVFYVVVIPAQIPLRNNWGADIVFTSRTYPSLLAIALIIMSVIGMAASLRRIISLKKQGMVSQRTKPDGRAIWKMIVPYVVFLLILAYGILFSSIGFIWATLLIPPVILFVLGCRKWPYYLFVYLFAAGVYALFRFVLHVALP